jgi:hypothetical protein
MKHCPVYLFTINIMAQWSQVVTHFISQSKTCYNDQEFVVRSQVLTAVTMKMVVFGM